MKRLLVLAVLLVLALGALAFLTPTPTEAARPCIDCPLVPLPDECPPCTQWVAGTCNKCPRCERIPGCKT